MRHDDARPRKRRRPPLRRKTVRWSAKEVDALLAGVRVHGVGKWAAILRHSPVFNGVRTSVDLKDKWRNLTSPVRAAALSNRNNSAPADQSTPDPSNHESEQHPLDPERISDHNDLSSEHNTPQPACSQPILDSPESPQQAPMSPIHSQEDEQQTLEHHTPDISSHPASHSNSDPALLSPPNSDSNLRPLHPDHPKSPAKIEPNLQHNPAGNSQIHPLHPPSESSVSPEVLSNPPQTPFSQSPLPILPQTHPQPHVNINPYAHLPQHPYPSQPPGSTPPSQQHVAAMQQFMSQSLYQSAAVLADYWRRIGHDPTAYSMAFAPGDPISSHHYPYYATRMGSLYNSDDDDDDDDDEDDHITSILPAYSYPYFLNLKKPAHVPETRAPLYQSGLRDETCVTQSRNPGESVDDGNAKRKLETHQVTGKRPCPRNDATKKSAKNATNRIAKQESLASSSACPPDTTYSAQEGTRDGTSQSPKRKRSLAAHDVVKKETAELRSTPCAEAASPEPDMATSAAVDICAKQVKEPDLKPAIEQTGFESVPPDIAYFPDEDFTAKSQQGTEQDKDENVEGEITDQASMGMAPLSFPGLGVEEQRQFSATDLV